jgi:L-ascorbate metabolism protein UlaG (beta-lactamase superfamily)
MHWGTFKLTDEPVGEPPERIRAYWARKGLAAERLWVFDVGETRPLVRT